MATQRSVKYQVGRGMILAGVFLTVPGAVLIMLGCAQVGWRLEVIPGVLVGVGLHLIISEGQKASAT